MSCLSNLITSYEKLTSRPHLLWHMLVLSLIYQHGHHSLVHLQTFWDVIISAAGKEVGISIFWRDILSENGQNWAVKDSHSMVRSQSHLANKNIKHLETNRSSSPMGSTKLTWKTQAPRYVFSLSLAMHW